VWRGWRGGSVLGGDRMQAGGRSTAVSMLAAASGDRPASRPATRTSSAGRIGRKRHAPYRVDADNRGGGRKHRQREQLDRPQAIVRVAIPHGGPFPANVRIARHHGERTGKSGRTMAQPAPRCRPAPRHGRSTPPSPRSRHLRIAAGRCRKAGNRGCLAQRRVIDRRPPRRPPRASGWSLSCSASRRTILSSRMGRGCTSSNPRNASRPARAPR
jgi:hypothetical protein